jgi:hypothetical protein
MADGNTFFMVVHSFPCRSLMWRRQNGPQLHHDGPIPRALLCLIYAHGAHYDKCVNARSAHFPLEPVCAGVMNGAPRAPRLR